MRITQFYADNFRCLQNFEFFPKQTSLLMGINGAGKSSIREVIYIISRAMAGADVRDLFSVDQLTAWDKRSKQLFSIEMELNEKKYKYRLMIEHDLDRKFCKVHNESLTCNHVTLFYYDGEHAQLYRDDGSEGPRVISDWHRSGISQVPNRRDNTLLHEFREAISRSIVLALNPIRMSARSEAESGILDEHGENFIDWLRLQYAEHQDEYFRLIKTLTETLPGFNSFRFDAAGEGSKECHLNFADPNGTKFSIRFDRISDGQRVLIILHSLLAFAKYYPIVFLDEPQNFVSLQEIQPWLLEAMDRFEDVDGQLLLSSHNSELINVLASEHGFWLERSPTGPTRIKSDFDFSSPLAPSEVVVRGWLNE